MKQESTTPDWPAEYTVARLERCLHMLNLHGMVTDAEYERIGRRLAKARKKAHS